MPKQKEEFEDLKMSVVIEVGSDHEKLGEPKEVKIIDIESDK